MSDQEVPFPKMAATGSQDLTVWWPSLLAVLVGALSAREL